jgi:hypothetical protein
MLCGLKLNTKMLQFLPYGRSIGSWICFTHKTYTCHMLQCCVCRLYPVYWNESTQYNFRTSNYVQQRKTYTRKAATVHLNCSTVPCNTLCGCIAAAVWRKRRDVICEIRGTRPWYAVPSCKTYPCQNYWHGYVLREEGTQCIAHIVLCKL